MTTHSYEKFKNLLAELFMFDQADLDFGIYRIMNAKRDEINGFLDNDLLPQAKAALGTFGHSRRADLETELNKAVKAAAQLDVAPDASPKVQELRKQLAETTDSAALEEEVFSYLYNFFRRYYDAGDFISLRRYKPGVYAIPYEGEEVKLHWANADQYYIKSGPSLRDYAFRLGDGRRVHFKLVGADAEANNTKPESGRERRFMLCESDALREERGELVIRFDHKIDSEKRKQAQLNEITRTRIFSSDGFIDWIAALAHLIPTEKNPTRTVLDKHLTDYAARNTFDYFIHKDLGGFLRRELDFFIKNEVMHLDDIENQQTDEIGQRLAKIKAIRKISHKIIALLEQLENFQKKLWLKRKFVVEAHWCLTLDRIPEAFYAKIAANDEQREEWVRLFAIDRIEPELMKPGYGAPLTIDFLKTNPFLVLDTRFFPSDFTTELLASDTVLGSASSLDEATDGLLIQSENFQALNLIAPLFKGNFKCVYIDPPYNTDSGPIDYKNGYKSSTWATLIANRLALTPELMRKDAVLCATIDDFQQKELHYLIEQCFGGDHLAGTVVIRSNPAGRPVPSGFAQSHEYAIFAMRSSESQICKLPRSERQAARYRHQDSVGSFMWELFRKRGTASEKAERPSLYYPIYVSGESVRVPAMKFDEGRREWVDIEPPSTGEIVAFPIDESGTQRRWRGAPTGIRDNPTDYKAVVENASVTIYYKFYPGSDGVLPSTSWIDPKYSATEYGTGVLKEFFTEYDPFSYPKSVFAVEDCLRVMGMSDGEGTVLDYFAGSGTTAHAIINLNRQDGGKRKYVLIEVDDHFRTVLKPRLQKVVYSKDWKGGNPVSREGSTHMFKYIRLESYEDSLNNLRLKPRTSAQQTLLDGYSEMREAYLLRYMLNVEADASQSLLSIDGFEDPFNYGLQIATGTVGESRPVVVDLVETFNYLIGLRVRRVAHIHGFRLVEGRSPEDKNVLIIWRNTKEKSNAALDAVFREHCGVPEDGFHIIYANGDNNLQNLRLPEEHWEVRLIEEEFLKRMFDVRDV